MDISDSAKPATGCTTASDQQSMATPPSTIDVPNKERKRPRETSPTPMSKKPKMIVLLPSTKGEGELLREVRHLNLTTDEKDRYFNKVSLLGVTESTRARLEACEKEVKLFRDRILSSDQLYLTNKQDLTAIFSAEAETKLVEQARDNVKYTFSSLFQLAHAARDLVELQVLARQEKRAAGVTKAQYELEIVEQAATLHKQRMFDWEMEYDRKHMGSGESMGDGDGMGSGDGMGGGDEHHGL
ncbi:hypothetical protein N431DRAFT_482339 [Stipitochalara longipes BDJ]|nr:hypothetical protein N431DRAFT_482339 [Stipitochalara longipes BDJ]